MKNDHDILGSKFAGQNLLEYELFNSDIADHMFESLSSAFDLKSPHIKYLDINTVKKSGQFLGVIDEDVFKLSEQIHKSKIIDQDIVHIHYLNFSKVYAFKVSDVDKFFDDIYYPGANDIMISDKQLSWMFYIDHDCYLYEYRAKSSRL